MSEKNGTSLDFWFCLARCSFLDRVFQKTIVKINFNEYEKLIEPGHSSFMKKITPKFSKCRRCGNVLKSHSKRYAVSDVQELNPDGKSTKLNYEK